MGEKSLEQKDIVGFRIKQILGNSETSEKYEINYTDFLFVLASGVCFRLPDFNPDIDWKIIKNVEPNAQHLPLRWPNWTSLQWWNNRKRLWQAKIVDILRPKDEDELFPDSAIIALSSGWYIWQRSAGPNGIGSGIGLSSIDQIDELDRMISFWD